MSQLLSSVKVVTAPAKEPLTRQEVKDWLKISTTADDALIDLLIVSARKYAEKITGRALYTQTVEEYYDTWNYVLYMSITPVASVTSVQYKDENGTYQTWATTQYSTDLIGSPGRIVVTENGTFPDTGMFANAIKITYVSGQTSTATIDADVKTAMLLKIAMWYENREDMRQGMANERSADVLLSLSNINLI